MLAFLRLLDGFRTRTQILWRASEFGIPTEVAIALLDEIDSAGLLSEPPGRSARLRTVHVQGRGPLSDAIMHGLRRIGVRPSHSRDRAALSAALRTGGRTGGPSAGNRTGEPSESNRTGEPPADNRTGGPPADNRAGGPPASNRTGTPPASNRTGGLPASNRTGEPLADSRTGKPRTGNRTGEPPASNRTEEPLTGSRTGKPLGGNRTGGRHASSRIRSEELGAVGGQPQLVVLADSLVPPPDLVDVLVRQRIPHLQVRIRDGHGVIGPLVLPGATSCLHCADLHRGDYEPEWPHLCAQLLGRVGQASPAGIAATAGLALTEIEVVLAGAADRPPVTLDATLELNLDSRRLERRGWPPHPSCLCRESPVHARV